MKLVNPKGSVEKVKKLRSIRIVLVGAIILAALVGSFIVMFPNIKEMLLTNHTSGGEIRFLYVLGILAVAIILLIVVCVLIGGAIKSRTSAWKSTAVSLFAGTVENSLSAICPGASGRREEKQEVTTILHEQRMKLSARFLSRQNAKSAAR